MRRERLYGHSQKLVTNQCPETMPVCELKFLDIEQVSMKSGVEESGVPGKMSRMLGNGTLWWGII